MAWRFGPLLQWADCERRLAALPISQPDVVIGSPVFCLRALARRFPAVPRVYLPHARIAPMEVAGNLAGSPSKLLRWTAYKLYYQLERWALVRSRSHGSVHARQRRHSPIVLQASHPGAV